MPSFKIIGLLVLKKKIFQDFGYLKPLGPSWSCDLDHLYKLSFPLPKDAPHQVWLCLAKQFLRRNCLNDMVIYMYIAPEQRQTTPGPKIFS